MTSDNGSSGAADLLILDGRVFVGFGPTDLPPYGSEVGPRPVSAPTGVASEAAILVGVVLPHHQIHGDPLEELEGLATTAGSRIVGRLTQRRATPDVTTYLGKGKVDELRQMVGAADRRRAAADREIGRAVRIVGQRLVGIDLDLLHSLDEGGRLAIIERERPELTGRRIGRHWCPGGSGRRACVPRSSPGRARSPGRRRPVSSPSRGGVR